MATGLYGSDYYKVKDFTGGFVGPEGVADMGRLASSQIMNCMPPERNTWDTGGAGRDIYGTRLQAEKCNT